MRYLSLLVVLAFLTGFAYLCGDPASGAQKDGAWGDVKGQIVWGGNGIPEAKKLDVNKDQAHCLSKGNILSEEWVINKENKGIRYAVVWLVPEGNGQLPIHPSLQSVPKNSAVMDQPCCKFEPRVVALREGQPLTAKNSAPIAHNFKWGGIKNRGDNKLMPPNTSFDIADLKAVGFPVVVECNIHPWMKGWVHIFSHPYYAVTDENGKFEIKNAPAGKHRIVVWQEATGYRKDKTGEPITIKAGDATDVGKLDLKPR